MAMTNDVLGEWARNSIMRNPTRYVANCIFNYRGLRREIQLDMWRTASSIIGAFGAIVLINYRTLGQWSRWRLYL
jgi:hypothetical protein